MHYRKGFLAICVIALVVLSVCTTPARAQVCGDGTWDNGEWCGQDALAYKGIPDMNHDCVVNLIDLRIFSDYFPPNAPATTADLNNDGLVNIADYSLLAAGFGATTTAVCGQPKPVLSAGTIALSFSSNPMTIVPNTTQSTGLNSVYVIIDGWMNADITQWSIEYSSNIVLINTTANVSVTSFSPFLCGTAPVQYSGWTTPSGYWSNGPVLFATIDYFLSNTNPAYFRFVALQANCYNDPGPRWGNTGALQMYEFQSILNAGINGGTPGVTTGVEDEGASPEFAIVSLSPNPFNPSTTVNFTLPTAMPVSASIFSVDGKRIRTLATSQMFNAGENRLTWYGRNDAGSVVTSGVYFVQLKTRLGTEVKRAVLLK